MDEWSVYLIKTRLNTLYAGISKDVHRRLREHESTLKGARYLRGKGPLELVWHACVGEKSTALRLEYRIKRLNRQQKQQLIQGDMSWKHLLTH